jgi:hypothetical protein
VNRKQRPGGKPRALSTAGGSSSSSSSVEDVVAVTQSTDSTSAAAFISSKLLSDPRAKLRLNAAGGQAGLNALKMLAKAGQMIEKHDSCIDDDSGSQLSFRVERRLLRLGGSSSSSSSSAASDEATTDPRDLSVNAFFVKRERAGRLSAALTSADAAPMVVRLETEPAKITQHALYFMKRGESAGAEGKENDASSWRDSKQPQQAVAAFVLAGGSLPARVKTLLRGLSDARRQLYESGEADLMFTVERNVRAMTEDEHQQWQQRRAQRQQQQRQDEEPAAADDEDAVAARVGTASGDGSSSSNSGSSERPMTKAVYIIKVYPCRPKSKAQAAQRRRRGEERPAASSRSDGDGYVQVPAGEWAALREQLEVVPHLTQQLQTMTRQHEQLLSLLAAQQQGAGAGGAADDATQEQQ